MGKDFLDNNGGVAAKSDNLLYVQEVVTHFI